MGPPWHSVAKSCQLPRHHGGSAPVLLDLAAGSLPRAKSKPKLVQWGKVLGPAWLDLEDTAHSACSAAVGHVRRAGRGEFSNPDEKQKETTRAGL